MPNEISKIIADFPQFQFKKAKSSLWSAQTNTIFYTDNTVELLHEISHAVLGHSDFTTDVDLIKKERSAWTKAEQLAQKYGVKIPRKLVEQDLDTYRDWLHFKSTCPNCAQNGIQSAETLTYHCFACRTEWKVNHDQLKRVKRTKIAP